MYQDYKLIKGKLYGLVVCACGKKHWEECWFEYLRRPLMKEN